MEQLQEALEKHRQIKHMILRLLEKAESPNITKAVLKGDLFKIYLEIK